MPWRTLTPPDRDRGFEVGRRGWLVGRLTGGRISLMLVGRLRDGGVAVLFVDMILGGRGAPRCCQPVHAWLVRCWPASVWSSYGQVAAAAAVWLVRRCLGRLMVGSVSVGSVALLPMVVLPNVVCATGTSVSVLASPVLVGPSVA